MNKSLKINDKFLLEGIIKKFESVSPVVKNMSDAKNIFLKYIFVTMMCCLISILLNKCKCDIINIIYYIVAIITIFLFLMKDIINAFIANSGKGNNERAKINNLIGKYANITNYLAKMRKYEFIMLKRILIANELYRSDILDEIKDYCKKNTSNGDLKILSFLKALFSAYLTISFGIISIYISLNKDKIFNTETFFGVILNIISIASIIGIICLAVFVIYFTYKIASISIRKFYTYNRLEYLISELKIKNLKNENLNNGIQ